MLTPKQELELRKYGKEQGLPQAKVDAFIATKKAEKPASLFEAPKATPKKEGDGFLKSLIKDPVKTLLVKPATRLAQAGIATVGTVAGNDELANRAFQDITLDTPFGKYVIEGQKGGKEGIKQIAKDTGKEALELFGGRVAGAAVKGATKAGSKIIGKGQSLLSKAPKIIEETAEGLVSTVDNQTKTILNPTRLLPEEAKSKLAQKGSDFGAVIKREKFDSYLKQAQKALNNPAQITPLEMAGKKAEEALEILNTKLSKQGGLKGSVLDEIGTKKVGGLTKAKTTLQQLMKEKVGANLTSTGVKNAKGRISKISLDPADNNLVVAVYNKLGELKFSDSIRKVDDVVDAVQDLLYKRNQNVAVPVNSQVEAILKQTLGELNGMVKKAAGKTYRKSNTKYSNFIELRDKLNKALGADANKGGSLMKRVFSPTDGGTKKLFAEIKKATGIDLVEEAALAKHVMEIAGDPRGNNLLELLKQTGLPTPSNVVSGTGKFLLNKVRDPIKESYKLIEQGKLKP